MTGRPEFSSKQARSITGVTYRQLDYWARTDQCVPTRPASGSGSARRYSLEDLVVLRVLVLLRQLGVGEGTVRPQMPRVGSFVREALYKETGGGAPWHLCIAPHEIWITTEPPSDSAVLVTVNISQARAAIVAAVSGLAA